MRKGTTPTLTFTIPIDPLQIEKVRIVFAENNSPILTKTHEDCFMNGNDLVLRLTQEETFLFECDHNYQVQMRFKLVNGDVKATDIMCLPVERCLDEEVL